MSGFGDDDFGNADFGHWPWSKYQLVDLMPEVYRTQDIENGGQLTNLQTAVGLTFDEILYKVENLGDLRDPLLAPTDQTFSDPVIILAVDNLGDGTSRVFISQGSSGAALDGIRIGMTLTDSLGNVFNIVDVDASGQATDFDDAPIDPFTDSQTGKNITVENIALANLNVIPQVSGYVITNETQTTTPTDNGTNVGPYSFTLKQVPLALNLVTINWTESSVAKVGYFANDGTFFGQLLPGSSINYSTGAIKIYPANAVAVDNASIKATYTTQRIINEFDATVPVDDGTNTGPYVFTAQFPPLAHASVFVSWTVGATTFLDSFDSSGTPGASMDPSSTINFTTGTISFKPLSGSAVNAGSLFIASYLSEIVLPPVDAVINGQNLLAFLGSDFGLVIDRHDPEALQRSYVYNAYQLWDLKGSAEGYTVLGQMAGFIVVPSSLYKVASSFTGTLPAENVFSFTGELVELENPGFDLTNWISPLEDGTTVGTFTVQLTNVPDPDSSIILVWEEQGATRTATLTGAVISGLNAADVSSFVDVGAGSITVLFATGHPPDVDSIRFTYNKTDYYTDLAPNSLIMDDVILDVIYLDVYCFDSAYPDLAQTVTTSSIEFIRNESGNARYLVTVTTTQPFRSFMTEGIFTDSGSNTYMMEAFTSLSGGSYSFQVVKATPGSVATGAGTVTWKVLLGGVTPSTFTDLEIAGIGTDVFVIGPQYQSYTGVRYRWRVTLAQDIAIGNVGDWKIIDGNGVMTWIEKMTPVTVSDPTFIYDLEFVSPSPPPTGGANIYYSCENVSSCIYCAASAIRVTLQPDEILNYPDVNVTDAANRLIASMQQMIPAHVRIADFELLDYTPPA